MALSDTNKRYYWLKLKDDFFRQKEIKQLRRVAGGEVFIIIYLKMLLRSLKDGGRLYYEGIDDDFVSELALDIDEDVENVKITVAFLTAKGLLVQGKQDEYELTAAEQMTGSEGYSAERMRKMRNKRALTSQSDVLLSQSDASVTQGDEEKRYKRKEIDIDIKRDDEKEDPYNPFGEGRKPERNTVYAYASNELVSLSQRAMQEIGDYVNDLSEDVVRHAIDNALDQGVRTWAYVKTILNGYVDAEVHSVGDAKRVDEEYSKKRKGGTKQENTEQPTDKKWQDMTPEEQEYALNHGPFGPWVR
jgi:predicted phage replisome organizer